MRHRDGGHDPEAGRAPETAPPAAEILDESIEGVCHGSRVRIPLSGRTPLLRWFALTWTTFLIEGTVTEVNGLDVAAGTRVTGRISFDPDAPGTFVPGSPSNPVEDPDSVVYRGVAVELTVGSQLVRRNDRAASTIQLAFLMPSYDLFRVEAPTGFRFGRVAGQTMNRFWLGLIIIPSRWPNQSIPLDPTVFDPGFAFPVTGLFCLGACGPGQSGFLLGQVTRVTRED